MNNNKIDLILIRGAPGAGKSQSAKCLSQFFPQGIRIEIDTLRSMVISVDWKNQNEHIGVLSISTQLVCNFINLGFGPVIVVDTFSGNKMVKYLAELHDLNNSLRIQIIGLYTNQEELKRRILLRNEDEFREYSICHRLNE